MINIKLKVRQSASKRYRLTRTGKVIYKQAYKAHILEKKTPKRKRQLRRSATVFKGDAKTIQLLLHRNRRIKQKTNGTYHKI